MATYTTNYNLEKPDASDDFGDFRASYNSNMDIIDQNLGGGGGGGGGHTIVDPDGTTMPNRSKLKFTGSVSVTDDSANNQTVVNITGGGGGGGEYYLNDGLIGSSGGTYITCNLDKTLVNGYYLVVVDDAGSRTYTYMEWNGTTQTLVIGANWQLQITSTTAGLTYYSGAWRNIYCDILSLGGSGGSGDTVTWTQIQATGEKIAEITINGTTTDVLIPFEAKIIVTTTTGLTVTATKGGTTYTATETSTGVYEVTVDSKGTWTVTDGTNTDTVNVTAQTTYNVAFVVIPDGSTVTPTDDIQTWLNCANIWDKAYTTLAEVLADTTTLSALISSNNAVDYLVRSTTFIYGVGKVPVMTSATTPSGTVSGNAGASGHPGYLAFDGDNDTYYQRSSETSASINYSFTESTNIRKMYVFNKSSVPMKFSIYQGTTDATNVICSDVVTIPANSGDYINVNSDNISAVLWKCYAQTVSGSTDVKVSTIQYYRDGLVIDSTAMSYIGLNNYCANKLLADATWRTAICNSTYFESVLNVKVPVMTSNTTPEGQCFTSSQYDSNYGPWKAFNGGSGSWISGNGQYANSYLGYIFTKNTIVYMAKITQAHVNRTPKNYKLQAFDGVNWIDVTETLNPFNGTSTPITVFNQFTKNIGSYPRYRLLIPTIQVTSENIASVKVLQFYGREDV